MSRACIVEESRVCIYVEVNNSEKGEIAMQGHLKSARWR